MVSNSAGQNAGGGELFSAACFCIYTFMEIAYTFTDKDATLFFREYSSDWRESKRKRGPQSKSWMTLYYFLLLSCY